MLFNYDFEEKKGASELLFLNTGKEQEIRMRIIGELRRMYEY